MIKLKVNTLMQIKNIFISGLFVIFKIGRKKSLKFLIRVL